jgi:hypothetical protein
MDKKISAFFLAFLIMGGCFYAFIAPAEDAPAANSQVSQTVDIIPELKNLGYRRELLISYDKEGEEEFFTFWVDKEKGETVTYIVENGKIKQASNGQTTSFLVK